MGWRPLRLVSHGMSPERSNFSTTGEVPRGGRSWKLAPACTVPPWLR
jgi:hypothetical protein